MRLSLTLVLSGLQLAACASPSVNKRSPTVLEKRSTDHSTTGPIAEGIVGYKYDSEQAVTVLQEASKIMDQWWDLLWDDDNSKFYDASPLCSTNEPNFGPVVVAFQALAEGCLKLDNRYVNRLTAVYSYMSKFYNSDKGGYAVRTSDMDVLDTTTNAQALMGLLKAYKATSTTDYLTRAKTLADFLLSQKKDNSGFYWQTSNKYVPAISTAQAAEALLDLYSYEKNSAYLEAAENAMSWLYNNLWDSSTNMINDGMSTDGTIQTSKLSYHVGSTLSSSLKLYSISGNSTYKSKAEKLSQVAINRKLSIFETRWTYNIRWWNNKVEYWQLLTKGLKEFYTDVSNDNVFFNELTREARLLYDFGRGYDGMYFTTIDPLGNSQRTYDLFNMGSGNTGEALNSNQFCKGDTNSFNVRYLVNQAAAARIFFFLSDITESI